MDFLFFGKNNCLAFKEGERRHVELAFQFFWRVKGDGRAASCAAVQGKVDAVVHRRDRQFF
jgi:L-asparaginase II